VVIKNLTELDLALESLGKATGYAVKSQVHAGGRGLGYFKESGLKGGVHVVKTVTEAKSTAQKMLGNTLVTKQTGENGLKVNALYIVEKVGYFLKRRGRRAIYVSHA
jgi:succinyl-CoA synthetase beta subunit